MGRSPISFRSSLLLPLIASLLLIAASMRADNLFGEYVGILRHHSLKRDQLAKLDFVSTVKSDGSRRLIGVLTLHFGDFASREYVSYHFEDVHYDDKHGTLIFDQANQPISIVSQKFGDGVLEGRLRSVWTGPEGRLYLRLNGTAQPKYPLLEPVWGEYSGTCYGQRYFIRLYTMRSLEDTSHLGHPFATFDIHGQVGELDPHPTLGRKGEVITTIKLVREGAYNFFRKELTLLVHPGRMECDAEPTGLQCGECFFRRTSAENAGPRVMRPVRAREAFTAAQTRAPLPELESTVYRGYLHHEFLDMYQRLDLSLLAYPDESTTPRRTRLSPMAKLFFGDESSSEYIPYRFQDWVYPPRLPSKVVFRNQEADLDPILEITSVTKEALRGRWFSRLFGRVGTLELRSDHLPTLPEGARIVGMVGVDYESTDGDLHLQIRQGRTPINTDNPFFPNVFGGDFHLRSLSKLDEIKLGSYDFYTGRIGVQLESARYLIGDLLPRGILRLNMILGKNFLLTPTHEPVPFRRKPMEDEL